MAEPHAAAPNPGVETEPLAGLLGGRYQIGIRLGKGGMGEVYKATDTRLKTTVALKRLAPHLRADSEYRRRFRHEAERAARANDSHVAAIYDVFEERGELFLVMEFVEGQTLRERLRLRQQQPMTLGEFYAVATESAEGLAEAHQRGVVHCDIKPENIMLTTSGHVKILDFGVAKQLPRPDQSSTIDRSGHSGGTPAYMAPEVLMQLAPDGRADIFSLGIVFYEVLAGKHPFLAENFFVTTDRIRNEAPPPVRTLNREVPAELEAVVSKCLAKDPEQRYHNARELLEDLRAAHGEVRHDTPHIVLPVPQGPSSQRWAVTLAALVLIALSVWGGTRLWRGLHPPFRERGQALIADFGSAGQDSIPGQEVREGLSIVLGQSPYVNVYPRQQAFEALARMKRAGVTRIDESLGLEICRRENLDVLLAGSIERAGQAFQITVRVLKPDSGSVLFTEQQRFASKDQFFGAMDALQKALRRDLGESNALIEKNSRPLAKVTTASLDALRFYSEASDYMAQGKVDAVPGLLQVAVKFDPDFAMAHHLMARAYVAVGNSEKEIQETNRSYELRNTVTDRERGLIEADYYSTREEYGKEAEVLKTLVAQYPEYVEAHRDLAMAYRNMGNVPAAIQEVSKVLQLDGSSAEARGYLVLLLAKNNQNAEAVKAYQDAVTKGFDTPRAKLGYGLALLGEGNTAGAEAIFADLQKAGEGNSSVGQIYLARALVYQGKLTEAEHLLTSGVARDDSAGNASAALLGRYLLASIYFFQDRQAEVSKQLTTILTKGDPAALQVEDLRRAGTLYAAMGNLKPARSVLERLQALRGPTADPFSQSCYENLAGEIALAEGQAGNALQHFQGALAAYPRAISHSGLARAHAVLGRYDDAAREWGLVLQAKGEILQDFFPFDWEIAHLKLGQISQTRRDANAARGHYQDLLKLWAGADNFPLRKQALQEYNGLGEGTSPPS